MEQDDKIKELKKELTISFVKMLREKDLYTLFTTNDKWKQKFIYTLSQAIEMIIRYSMRISLEYLPTDSLYGCSDTILFELRKRGFDMSSWEGRRNLRQAYLDKLKLNDNALSIIDDILSNCTFVKSKIYFQIPAILGD